MSRVFLCEIWFRVVTYFKALTFSRNKGMLCMQLNEWMIYRERKREREREREREMTFIDSDKYTHRLNWMQ